MHHYARFLLIILVIIDWIGTPFIINFVIKITVSKGFYFWCLMIR
jgi:hypothetical protein